MRRNFYVTIFNILFLFLLVSKNIFASPKKHAWLKKNPFYCGLLDKTDPFDRIQQIKMADGRGGLYELYQKQALSYKFRKQSAKVLASFCPQKAERWILMNRVLYNRSNEL